MGHNWILDVLADLKAFAQENDLPLLAAQLDETALVAQAELTSVSSGGAQVARGDVVDFGKISRAAATGGRA